MFARYLERFLVWCLAMGLSSRTVDARRRTLRQFITWCAERSIDDPRAITLPVLERYRRYLFHYRSTHGKPLGLSAQRNRLSALRTFFRWLAKEHYIPFNPAADLEMPKVHKRLPRAVLSADEVERVMAHTYLYEEHGIRDRAILETLYATGIRRQELVNLTLYDVDIEQGTLMVRQGKGNKDRLLPIGERACAWIDKYVQEVRPQLLIDASEPTLFLTDYGEPFIKGRLTQLVKKKYLNAVGIDKPGACHLFRHTMATLMLENGADLRFIQAMLGHSDISTTTIYTQVSIKKLREVYLRTHPAKWRGEAAAPADESALLAMLEIEADDEAE